MYDLFKRSHPSYDRISLNYPRIQYIRRQIKEQISDVKTYYALHPKRVDSNSILGNILIHIPRRWDYDDVKYLRFVEDTAPGVSRAFGLVSPIFRGKVHENGVTLGPKVNEVIISTIESVELNDIRNGWRKLKPLQYLYHTRTDLSLPIMNNTTPGRGNGVATLNIPMMALQYRYWLKQQSEMTDQKESIYRFIGSVVLPNAIESFMDIAIFNRMSRMYRNLGTSKHPNAHPFYLTDYSSVIDDFCMWVNGMQGHNAINIERIVGETPMIVKDSLFGVLALPRDPVTRQNEWALVLARLPFIRYLIDIAMNSRSIERGAINDIRMSLIDFDRDNIFSGVGSTEIIKSSRSQLKELLDDIEQLS